MAGLGCGFSQPAPPQSPSRLRPLGLRGRKTEFPASNRISSAHTTSRNKYSTTLLEDSTSWDVVSVTLSFQTSRRILDERDIGQSRAAESRPQLEPLLKRFLVIFIRCVFYDNSVIPFTDFAALFGLAFPLLRDSTSRGGEAGSETNFTTSSCNKHIG
jgi:hypothetical protein